MLVMDMALYDAPENTLLKSWSVNVLPGLLEQNCHAVLRGENMLYQVVGSGGWC